MSLCRKGHAGLPEGSALRFRTVTIAEAIANAASRLAARRIENARLDAEVLLCFVLDRDRAWLVAHFRDDLDERYRRYYDQLLTRRAVREPLQYIIGRQEFWGLAFTVTPDVLIPRPETELVVASALELLDGRPSPVIADLCTGSGCIAVSLAKALSGARIFAADRSAEALAVARTNAGRHAVADRIRFLEGDLFDPLAGAGIAGTVDAVTANPPYVTTGEFASLQPEVRDFEPEIALVAGPAGTEVAERIIRAAPEYLTAGGQLVLEMGAGQAAALRSSVERTGAYASVRVLKDLAGIERVIVAKKH
jgi:release factor glutamine methyltransferase